MNDPTTTTSSNDAIIKQLRNEIDAADNAEALEAIKRKIKQLKGQPDLDVVVGLLNDLVTQASEKLKEKSEKVKEQSQKSGKYFEDAINLIITKPDREFDASDQEKMKAYAKKAFDEICRMNTPDIYKKIVDAAAKAGERETINLHNAGSNSDFEFSGGGDMFYKGVDPARAHIFPDSKTCGPAWGHMAEGATGKIVDVDNEDEKNRIRVIRMMGTSQDKDSCLRKNVRNFVALHNEHRVYYDNNPQLFIVPLLSLAEIKDWSSSGKKTYDVAVLVSSPFDDKRKDCLSCEEIYTTMLNSKFWDHYDEKKHHCTVNELKGALAVLRRFIKALAGSLKQRIPQSLLDVRARDDNSQRSDTNSESQSSQKSAPKKKPKKTRKKPPPGPASNQTNSEQGDGDGKMSKKKELENFCSELNELLLPYFREGDREKVKPEGDREKVKPVLKWCISGETSLAADPWLLMVKAAVNLGWLINYNKFLPACPRSAPWDNINEQYEEAMLDEERVERENAAVPAVLTIPAPGTLTLPTKGAKAFVTTPDDRDTDEESWESLSDESFQWE